MHIATLLLAFVAPTAASVIINNSSLTSQVRVAFHGDDGMVVSWNTLDQLDTPTVNYGLAADSMTMSASSNVSITYPTSRTYNNHVWLSGLLPDTTYYYQPQHVLANETIYGPYTFKTARPAGDDTPYSIAFVCDMGTMGSGTLGLTDIPNKKTHSEEVLQPGEQTTINSLVELMDSYDFVVHPGDIAYSDYFLKEELAGYINATLAEGPEVYETILDEFYDEMEAISALRPYMIGVGNHEADCDNGGTGNYTASICVQGQTNFTGVRNHFRMPSDISGGVSNFWYSFDYGMVHYVYFNTETDLGNGLLEDEQSPYFAGPFGSYPNEQVDWLAADLAAVDRCATPWVIALGHRPWFSSGSDCTNCSLAFAQIFETYGVDLVLQGHFHVYERNLPVFTNGTIDPNGYANPSAPWYLINGLAGHWDGMDKFTLPLQEYQAFGLDRHNATYGWSRLHFFNNTHLRHEFIASSNNSVLDSTVFYKEHVCHKAASSSVATNTATPAVSTSSVASVSTSIAASISTSVTSSTASAISTTTVSSSYTTSTILSTHTYTITSCASTVTNCPVGHVTTEVITMYTTWCPVAATEKTAAAPTTAVTNATMATTKTTAATTKVTSTTAAFSGYKNASSTSTSMSTSSSSSSTGSGSGSTVVTAGSTSVAASAAGLLLSIVAGAVLLL